MRHTATTVLLKLQNSAAGDFALVIILQANYKGSGRLHSKQGKPW
jgi:hypothetical protein